MLLDLQSNVGLEQIATGAFEVLFLGINAEIAQIESEMVTFDQEKDEARGRIYKAVTLEPVDRNNFHLGHQPSLILDETPLTAYPSVSVMAYRSQTAPGSNLFDYGNNLRNSMYVEIVVKAGPIDPREPWLAFEICNKRLWRTVEAANAILMRHQDLNGLVSGLEDPSGISSEAFTRPESDENPENDWCWQAARLEYLVTKFSPFE